MGRAVLLLLAVKILLPASASSRATSSSSPQPSSLPPHSSGGWSGSCLDFQVLNLSQIQCWALVPRLAQLDLDRAGGRMEL